MSVRVRQSWRSDVTVLAPVTPKCSAASSVAFSTFGGVPIHALTPAAFTEVVLEMLECDHPHVVHFLSADPLTIARRNATLASTLQVADLNVPDGLPVVWAVSAAGGRVRRITGSDGLSLICEAGVEAGVRHFFFGSSPETVKRLESTLTSRFPGIDIVGADSPPYRPLSGDEVSLAAQKIRALGTDVLWVGLGAPQQNMVAEQLRRFNAAPVIVTIGAAFDFSSGAKRRAPQWMQRVGLEWLFRLIQEPRRLGKRYLVGNARFIADSVLEAGRARRTPSVGRLEGGVD